MYYGTTITRMPRLVARSMQGFRDCKRISIGFRDRKRKSIYCPESLVYIYLSYIVNVPYVYATAHRVQTIFAPQTTFQHEHSAVWARRQQETLAVAGA